MGVDNVLFNLILRICAQLEELHIIYSDVVNVRPPTCKTFYPRLKCLVIDTGSGMDQTEFGLLIEACPNLEVFEYSEDDQDAYAGNEPVSPAGMVCALKPCEKTLHSLLLRYNGYAHRDEDGEVRFHEEAIGDLRPFTKLERLTVSASDISNLHRSLPQSLKDLNLTFVYEDRVDELRRLAQGARQLLPVLQCVTLDASDRLQPRSATIKL